MSHSHHGGHKPMCNMNMLFTWDTTDLCIIFRSWHIRGPLSLIFSLLAIIVLTAGYEGVREVTRRYEASSAGRASGAVIARDPDDYNEESSLLQPGRKAKPLARSRVVSGALYAVQVFYSFFIMLLFMTYNGWVMFSVAVGAFVGYVLFAGGSAVKTVACH